VWIVKRPLEVLAPNGLGGAPWRVSNQSPDRQTKLGGAVSPATRDVIAFSLVGLVSLAVGFMAAMLLVG
jgi:hypothetical protein